MKFRIIALLVGTVGLLMLSAQSARADWLMQQLSRKDNTAFKRMFKVKIKDAEGMKEGEITVTFGRQKPQALKEKSKGLLYLNPNGTALSVYPSDKGEAMEMKEKRKNNTVTYTFRVSADQLPKLRFEFWDNGALGGEIYWFNLLDFLPTKR